MPDDKKIKGVNSPGAKTGPVDKRKTRIAKRLYGGMMNPSGAAFRAGNFGSMSTDAFNTSYATGNTMYGQRDIPTYFMVMNEHNGGILYWPVSLREKYEWYRYWARTDAYVGRALELLSDLPMSKITLTMPNLKDEKKSKEIKRFYEDMVSELKLFKKLQEILWEWNTIGNCFPFVEYDEKRQRWSNIIILPPEEVEAYAVPFSDEVKIKYVPEALVKMVQKNEETGSIDEFQQEVVDNIPKDVKDMIIEHGAILMDSKPVDENDKVSSFAYHFARRKSPYMDLGTSVLERVLVPMLMKENFRYTQLALATRNMTPKNKISAPGLNQSEIDDLRDQIDQSYMDPEFSIISNYEWDWEQIGADGRILDLQGEYEMIESQVFAGMGVTRELLTGEGSYSGERMTIEILNTVFMLTREMLREFVEEELFKPIAVARKWYDEDENGVRTYWHPALTFNRLSIRDNQEIFDNLFQLYQKGSLPIDIIFELLNLDSNNIAERVKEDIGTVKDSTFNRMVENLNDDTGRQLVENSNYVKKVAEYLGLEMNAPEGEDGGGFDSGFGGGFDSGFGGGFGDEEESTEPEDTGESEEMQEFEQIDEGGEESTEKKETTKPKKQPKQKTNGVSDEAIVKEVVKNLPEGATREDVEKVIRKIKERENEG